MDWRPGPNGSTRSARYAGLAVVAVASSVASAFVLLPIAVQAGVRVLTLVLDASVWLTVSLSSGADARTIAGTVTRAAADALFSSRTAGVVAILVLVAALALYGLQRLLGFDEESFK